MLILAVAGGLYARFGRETPSAGLPAGDTTAVILEEDENGMVTVTPDLLREYFPLLTGINFSTTSTTSDNIDDYLIENLQTVSYTHLDVYKRQTHVNPQHRYKNVLRLMDAL